MSLHDVAQFVKDIVWEKGRLLLMAVGELALLKVEEVNQWNAEEQEGDYFQEVESAENPQFNLYVNAVLTDTIQPQQFARQYMEDSLRKAAAQARFSEGLASYYERLLKAAGLRGNVKLAMILTDIDFLD